MERNDKEKEPIPTHFTAIEEAADFWNRHDLTDYWELTEEIADVEVDLQQHRYLFAVAPVLVRRVAQEARKQGISAEPLVNVWPGEKLHEVVA